MLDNLKNEMNFTKTENGAVALKTTNSDVLDFFAIGGGLRDESETNILKMFLKAFNEDKLMAMKLLFYFRDVRQGQGERRIFKVILNYLGNHEPELVKKNIHLISEYGRWDDAYVLVGTASENYLVDLLKEQFDKDLKSDNPSLLGKWLKSVNSKQKEVRKLGLWTAKSFGLTEKAYRKSVSSLRTKIDVVEKKMVNKDWKNIDYSKVPSKAMLNYRNAFARNDEKGFHDYIDSLVSGDSKVNTGAIYPYEIVRRLEKDLDGRLGGYHYNVLSSKERELYDEMWNSLPDFTDGSDENSMAVVDVSGSMYINDSLPLQVAVSLGLYLSERVKGPYKNHFFTFSRSPELVEVKGRDLLEKLVNMVGADWGMDTDLEAVFDIVLKVAVDNNISNDDIIKKLYVITDMEFNQAKITDDSNKTLMKKIEDKFIEAGYDMPKLVFINVCARNTHFPMSMDDSGVLMVSGMSPSIFKSLMSGDYVTGYDLMLGVLNSERYDAITI